MQGVQSSYDITPLEHEQNEQNGQNENMAGGVISSLGCKGDAADDANASGNASVQCGSQHLNRLVLIGRGLDRERVRKEFMKCFV